MISKTLALTVCRDIMKKSECSNEKFSRMCDYYGPLETYYWNYEYQIERRDKYDCDSEEFKELNAEVQRYECKIYESIAKILMESWI